LKKLPHARGQAANKAKGKGSGSGAERQQFQDAFEMSDDNVVMLETPMPHLHSRHYVAETPFEGIVALLFLVLV
jgi:hypothetical protein